MAFHWFRFAKIDCGSDTTFSTPPRADHGTLPAAERSEPTP